MREGASAEVRVGREALNLGLSGLFGIGLLLLLERQPFLLQLDEFGLILAADVAVDAPANQTRQPDHAAHPLLEPTRAKTHRRGGAGTPRTACSGCACPGASPSTTAKRRCAERNRQRRDDLQRRVLVVHPAVRREPLVAANRQ